MYYIICTYVHMYYMYLQDFLHYLLSPGESLCIFPVNAKYACRFCSQEGTSVSNGKLMMNESSSCKI